MSTIEIRKIGITDLDTDAIVNAANEALLAGGGVCGAIFKDAGHAELQVACNKIGHCDTGSAVITPGFKLKSKYIIHAVGPVWSGGNQDEPKLLYGAYRRSLQLAVENGCQSIGFPLLSAGIFGYPVDQAWRKAIQACNDFLEKGNQIDIVFAVPSHKNFDVGNKTLNRIAPQYAKAAKSDYSSTWKQKAAPKKGNSSHTKGDKLHIAGQEVDCVFFHKPSEPHGYLSNWFASPFVIDDIQFSSAEQYIMYRKCMIFGDQASADAVLATDDTKQQQDIGREAKGYIGSVWAGRRQLIAIQGLLAKFSQNEELKQKLLGTGDAWLVECAHSDTIWACGIRLNEDERFDARNWCGQNILGFALMEVRDILRKREEM